MWVCAMAWHCSVGIMFPAVIHYIGAYSLTLAHSGTNFQNLSSNIVVRRNNLIFGFHVKWVFIRNFFFKFIPCLKKKNNNIFFHNAVANVCICMLWTKQTSTRLNRHSATQIVSAYLLFLSFLLFLLIFKPVRGFQILYFFFL